MERIQAALEKARTERAARLSGDLRAVAPLLRAVDPPPSRSAETAWAALPTFQPDRARMERNRIVTLQGGPDATPFDVMRTKLLQQMRVNNWRRLAITSPAPACGKSTIALNLAFSLARQPDVNTILTEMDMRRPSLARMMGLSGDKALSQVFEGRVDFAEVAQRHGSNLALAVNHAPARSPAELLQSTAMPGVLDRIEAVYQPDLTIFDMPPMLVTDDVMAFVGQVDAVLLIAAAESSTIKEIDACERELATQTNVLGVVLNKCRYAGSGQGYSYYD